MEASDMLDVIHFFYDEDSRYAGYDQAVVVDKFRDAVFGKLYKTGYKYAVTDALSSTSSTDFSDLDASLDSDFVPDAPIQPFNPRAAETKPFVPPTEVSGDDEQPFGSLLDAPIG
jgi:hypothetical protein